MMKDTISFREDADDIPCQAVLEDPSHFLRIEINERNSYVVMDFSSRLAMYDFGRQLISQALYGRGEFECFPLVVDNKNEVVDGVRLSEDSPRLFVHYPR